MNMSPPENAEYSTIDRIMQYVDENPYWPLPADYPELSEDGKRNARLAAVSTQNTIDAFVGAWMLFRRMYLIPTEPGFFYHNYAESPPFHYDLIRFAAEYARNLVAAPRGYAKSVIIGTELPLMLMLTRPYIRIALGMATDKLIEDRFEIFNRQFQENPYIIQDFGLQRPKRGMAIWNRHHLQLLNGSKIQGFSVTGRKRGARPDLFILDDPEYDPDTEGGALVARDRFEGFLFKQIIPMLESGSGIYWIGTLIGRRSFIGHACYGDDKRFTYWNRRIYSALSEDPQTGKTELLWGEKWDEGTLRVRREEIGEAHFMSEYMNRPGSTQDRTLRIDPLLNEYTVEHDKPTGPLSLNSGALLKWYDSTGVEQRQQASEVFSKMYRIIAFDPARGLSAHHDYSCIAVMGFDRSNILWVLDMWMGRAPEAILMRNIFRLGARWRVHVIGIESVSRQIMLVDSLTTYVAAHRDELGDDARWMPRIVPVEYAGVRGGASKADRIMTLEWRFETGRIKYPAYLKNKWPFNMLYAQTEDFTYDLNLLEHDDAIDAVAMAHYIVHARGAGGNVSAVTPPKTFEQYMREGQFEWQGLPLINAFGVQGLTPEVLESIYTAHHDRAVGRPTQTGLRYARETGLKYRPSSRIVRTRRAYIPTLVYRKD